MSRLIIGHTTDKTVRIWVRGDKRNPFAFLNIANGDLDRNYRLPLQERFGFTGVIDVGSLQPSNEYECEVLFGSSQNEPETTRVEYGHTRGRFRTFPAATESVSLSFLLGSCNLHSLGLWQNPDRAYRTLLKVSASEKADFMIHCGDQIYYDIPNFLKQPNFEEYREKYIDAWGDSRPTRKLLTQLPHYMILDDHELVNNFATDMQSTSSGASSGDIMKHGLRVYREFQHIHNPNSYGSQALYYSFNHGGAQFFCLDTRSQRIESENAERTMMIDDVQMGIFKRWLSRNREAMKFVVTSVPFVGHVENNSDKWCSAPFRKQREEIMHHIIEKDVSGVTFLTGDMHNSYHATMEMESGDKKMVIHELMSSPINQTSKSSYGKYKSGYTQDAKDNNGKFLFSYKSVIERKEFFNDHSNAMLIKASGGKVRYEVFRSSTGKRRELKGEFQPF